MGYEQQLTVEELKLELRNAWDQQQSFIEDLIERPEVPSILTLWFLALPAMNHKEVRFYDIGKKLQLKYGLEKIPPKTELECAAGLWTCIRKGLLNK